MTKPATILSAARVILLDFDGPTCHLFFGYPAPVLADDLRLYLRGVDVDVAPAPGPYELYRDALDQRPDLADDIEAWLTAAEIHAAERAQATPGCREMLLAAKQVNRPVVMVSNNSSAAVRTYLERVQLSPYVAGITGRPHAAPDRMKPSPWLIQKAAQRQQVTPRSCVLIGDSVADVVAANAAGALSIGYANKPGKAERLTSAGAATLVDDMHELAEALL